MHSSKIETFKAKITGIAWSYTILNKVWKCLWFGWQWQSFFCIIWTETEEWECLSIFCVRFFQAICELHDDEKYHQFSYLYYYIRIGLFAFCLSISYSFYDYYPMTIQKWYLSFIARIHYLSFFFSLSLSVSGLLHGSFYTPYIVRSLCIFSTCSLSLLLFSPSPTIDPPPPFPSW